MRGERDASRKGLKSVQKSWNIAFKQIHRDALHFYTEPKKPAYCQNVCVLLYYTCNMTASASKVMYNTCTQVAII